MKIKQIRLTTRFNSFKRIHFSTCVALSLIFTLFFKFSYGQHLKAEKQPVSIASIQEQLKKDIGNKKVVLLGEPTHGEGNVFEYKTQICKFLHDSMGFNLIAFESGIYDLYQANQQIEADQNASSIPFLQNSIFSIWSHSEEFQSFIQWYNQNKSEIRLLGFDCQFSGDQADEYLIDSITDYIKKFNDSFTFNKELLYKTTTSFGNEYAFPSDINYQEFITQTIAVIEQLENILTQKQSARSSRTGEWYLQFMKNILMSGKDYYAKKDLSLNEENYKAYYSNPRDSMMAQNLLWQLKMYPDQKVICWGAAEHFMKNTSKIENKELRKYLPMGHYLVKALGESSIFNLTFVASSGKYGSIGEATKNVPRPVLNSLESSENTGQSIKYINLNSEPYHQTMVAYPLEYTPLKAVWSSAFNSFIYLNQFKRCHLILAAANNDEPHTCSNGLDSTFKSNDQITVPESKYHFQGKIIDAVTRQPIAFATIKFTKENIETLADKAGNFEVNLAINKADILITAIGYNPTLVTLKSGNFIQTAIQPFAHTLTDIVIHSTRMDAGTIIKKVKANLYKNYGRNPFCQQAFVKRQIMYFDSIILDADYVTTIERSKGFGEARLNYDHSRFNKQNKGILKKIGRPYNNLETDITRLDFIRAGFIFSGNRSKGYIYKLNRTYIDSLLGPIYVIGFKATRFSHKYTNGTFDSSMRGEIQVRKKDYGVLSLKFIINRKLDKINNWSQKYYDTQKNMLGQWNRISQKEVRSIEIHYAKKAIPNKYILDKATSSWFQEGYFISNHKPFKLVFKNSFYNLDHIQGTSAQSQVQSGLPPTIKRELSNETFWKSFKSPIL